MKQSLTINPPEKIAKGCPKYYINIDVDRECDRFDGIWANYDSIESMGNNLEELLGNASITAIDQDGGSLGDWPADEGWMQDLIETEFERYIKNAQTLAPLKDSSLAPPPLHIPWWERL